MTRILFTLLALGLIAGGIGLWFYNYAHGSPEHRFRTVTVERGSIVARISATGTIQPTKLVDVGTQVAGQIKKFGPDLRDSTKTIDYCAPVEEGTVLAILDDALFKSRVANAQADLKLAEAELLTAEAKVRQTERDWLRAKDLGPRGVVSGLDYDTCRANFETAGAAIARARASVEKAMALLNEAQINLGYTVIKSPVKGVIVDRRVNIGQTVVASLNAPSLFLIAQDLKQLEIWASVNEADIGQIYRGQMVRFSVDTFPDDEFRGRVTQIRLNANMQQNVVTYTVVVSADNSSEKLLPYMTTNLQFEVSQRDEVLVVPNAALRWKPQAEHVAPDLRENYAQSQRRKAPSVDKGPKNKQTIATLWVEDQGHVRPVLAEMGLTDGVVTEICAVLKGELPEGSHIVSGVQTNGEGPSVNPLMPRIPRY